MGLRFMAFMADKQPSKLRQVMWSNIRKHVFIPFVLDTLDFLTPDDVVALLHGVQMVMHINNMSPKSMNVVFMMINFVFRSWDFFFVCVYIYINKL